MTKEDKEILNLQEMNMRQFMLITDKINAIRDIIKNYIRQMGEISPYSAAGELKTIFGKDLVELQPYLIELEYQQLTKRKVNTNELETLANKTNYKKIPYWEYVRNNENTLMPKTITRQAVLDSIKIPNPK